MEAYVYGVGLIRDIKSYAHVQHARMAWVQASIFNMGFEWILKEEGGKCVPKL